MSRTVGFVAGQKVDQLVDADMLDRDQRRKLSKFLEELEFAVFTANREIIGRVIPDLDQSTFIRFAVVVAEARAHYVKVALEITKLGHEPPAADVERLRKARLVFEELMAAYDAAHRLIERGYTHISR